MSRSLLLLPSAALVGALALGCGYESTPTDPLDDPTATSGIAAEMAVDRLMRRGPWEEDITNPCTGGLIHFTGEIKEQRTAVGPQELLDQGSSLHSEDQTLLTGTGTDPVTGATYSIHRTLHSGFNSPTLEALNLTITFQTTVRAVTSGPGENFLIRIQFHVTFLPNGEVKTVVEHESAECRG
jgi:hypothetical protein